MTTPRIAGLFLIALGLGCGDAEDWGGLTIKELRLDESTVPLPFVVALHNDSDQPADIEGVSVNVTSKRLISRPQDADRIPEDFDFEVQFDLNHPMEVAASSDGVACGFLVWELPPDPPEMIAMVTCDFRVHANGKTLTTEPVTLVLQSREGLLDRDAAVPDNPLVSAQAKKVLDVLAQLPGKKSEGFVMLVRQLSDERAVTQGTSQ